MDPGRRSDLTDERAEIISTERVEQMRLAREVREQHAVGDQPGTTVLVTQASVDPSQPACSRPSSMRRSVRNKAGGAEGNRTPDLCSAIAALSHLSYSPAPPAGRRPDGVGPLGSGSLAAISAPCNRLSRHSFGPADLSPAGRPGRNGARLPLFFLRFPAGVPSRPVPSED